MKKAILAVAAACLAVSAQAQQEQDATGPARCWSAEMCEELMTHAQRYVQMFSGMRLRIVTATRLETFTANNFGLLTGEVTKEQVGHKEWAIISSFSCYRGTTCDDRKRSAVKDFDDLMRSQAKKYAVLSGPAPAASQ